MKSLVKNKINIKMILIYFGLSLCLLYTFGGFLKDNIIFDSNEVKLGRQCMLFNLKRLDFLKPNAMKKYEFNKYTRFAKRNPDIRMEMAYTDSDDVINYYMSKSMEKGWNVKSIEKESLLMHKLDTVKGKTVNVIFYLQKIKAHLWEITIRYEYITKT